MFPDQLDHADVLLYTDRGSYGTIAGTGGGPGWPVSYLAVCAYPDDEGIYLFSCDDKYDVITDSLYPSIEACLADRGRKIIWHRKQEEVCI